ncbi:MAG TPA: urea ABC transporter permease subunit UrtB [Polyangiaceae bacterium]|jgi:urea transport system permease protein|nr:urea ABC transporter permease subunit UrtB [Polyangiaceae bacterium]
MPRSLATAFTKFLLLAISSFALLVGSSARAGETPAPDAVAIALRTLAKNDPDKGPAAISALAATGSERARLALEALDAGKLKFDPEGQAFIVDDEKVTDALTGAPVAAPAKLDAPLGNNALRRALRPALAQLRLKSDDRDVRLAAATDLAKGASEELLDAMQSALDGEKDHQVAKLLRLSVAQLELDSKDKDRRLRAFATLKEDGDISHKGLLEPMLTQDSSGAYREPDAEIRAAAKSAIVAIDRRVSLINVVANLFYGISLGSVLLLAALGLAITFGLMKVINMAHGEMLMIGAYTTFVVQNFFNSSLPKLADYYLVAAVPAAFIVSGLVGLALERGVVRHLYGRPLETLLATWGISLLLIQSVRMIFGAQNVAVSNPSWLSGGWELMPTVVLPYSRLWIIAFTLVVVGFVWFLLRRTRLGLYVRAVTQNREMAGSLGIPTDKIDMWTFALGSAVAGLGGVAISQLGNVGPELGQGYIVDSFMVVVLGGVGNIIGTISGAMGLGLINKFLEPVAGAVFGKIVVLVLIILFIQKRPQGLFALRGRAAEL